MQANWARYVFASVADYFKEVASDNNLPVLVDHLDERTEALMKETDRAEIRITGPFLKHTSKGYYVVFVDVSVLLVSRYDGSRKNAYDILKYAGAFQQAMDSPIAIWNFGGEPGDFDEDDEDTQVFIGCLNPRPGASVQVLNFGQVDAVEKIKMTEVNMKYTTELQD
jgi:hypothetical protein